MRDITLSEQVSFEAYPCARLSKVFQEFDISDAGKDASTQTGDNSLQPTPWDESSRNDTASQTSDPPEAEYLAALTGRWENLSDVDVTAGLIVKVCDEVLSADHVPIAFSKGSRGRVLSVDSEGDAYVDFPIFAASGRRTKQCIFKHDFVKLRYLITH